MVRVGMLAELSRPALATLPLAALLDAAARLISEAVGVEACLVLEHLVGTGQLLVRGERGTARMWARDVMIPLDSDAAFARALNDGSGATPSLIDLGVSPSRFADAARRRSFGWAALARVAGPVGGEPWGQIAILTSADRKPGAAELEALELAAGLISGAVAHERARLEGTQAQANFRRLIERAPFAAIVHRNGTVLWTNRPMLRLLGYAAGSSLVGRPLAELAEADADSPFTGTASLWEQLRRHDITLSEVPMAPGRLRRADGSMVDAECAHLPIEHEGGPAFLIIARDVSARDQMSARVAAVDGMVAVGTLAAGAAHEINNPLAYVAANAEFVRRKLVLLREILGDATVDSRGDVVDLVDMVRALTESAEGVERVRDIVDKLRALARADASARRPVRVDALLEASLRMVHNEIRHRARVSVRIGQLPQVLANETRLTQVFLNLLLNAAQAIREGAATENEISIKAFVSNGMVVVEIKDTGSGIAVEDQPRIWDPFFTTRPVGSGTGLGLFVCRANVESHGGRVALVESRLGGGTTMRIELPALSTVELTPSAPTTSSSASGRRGRILVIDDEPLIGKTLTRALGDDNDVVAVNAGKEALALIDRGERFDVVFCDLMMPEMSGMDFYVALAGREPKLLDDVAFMTGGAFTQAAEEFLRQIPNPHFEKPFHVERLRAFVRDHIRTADAAVAQR